MTQQKLQYVAPSTSLTRVKIESDICAGSAGEPVHDNDSRHVIINKQDDGGSVDFTSPENGNTWD